MHGALPREDRKGNRCGYFESASAAQRIVTRSGTFSNQFFLSLPADKGELRDVSLAIAVRCTQTTSFGAATSNQRPLVRYEFPTLSKHKYVCHSSNLLYRCACDGRKLQIVDF